MYKVIMYNGKLRVVKDNKFLQYTILFKGSYVACKLYKQKHS